VAEPMRTVSFKLPEELDRALSDLARRRHSTRSALVREAIEKLTRDQPGSVLALAADLAGSVEGPSDLSTSPKHMTGYGK
jgi:predicted transcriptional regulator